MAAQKITVPALRARKAKGQKIAVLTAYDATFARLLDEGGADVLLVGDSLGMVVQGLQNTLPVTLEEICYHGRAVARAVQRAHVVGDMPFMSYQVSVEQALAAAGRMLKEGGFESVKLEGGEKYAAQVRAIVEAGIPVMGHVGLLPQSVHAMGGFRVQGTQEDAAELGQAVVEATKSYVDEVQAGQFPGPEHSFGSGKVPPPDRPTGSRPVVDAPSPPKGYGPASDPS